MAEEPFRSEGSRSGVAARPPCQKVAGFVPPFFPYWARPSSSARSLCCMLFLRVSARRLAAVFLDHDDIAKVDMRAASLVNQGAVGC
jgi:hypothetical protein